MVRYFRNKKILLSLLGAVILLLILGVALLSKESALKLTNNSVLPKEADALDIAVNDYLRSEGYDCQPEENWYVIAEARDFIPDNGFVVDEEGNTFPYEDYLIWLGYSCDGPMRGGGGNGPFIVMSRTADGYELVGELDGEAPFIEEAKPSDEKGVANIVVIGDDAPPGNYDVLEWKWDGKSGAYVERTLTDIEKHALLDKYLEPAQLRSGIMLDAAAALEELRDGDLAGFSEYVHPTKGIQECLRTWTPEQIRAQAGSDEVLLCGYGMASGIPINATFDEQVLGHMRTLNFLHAPLQEFDDRQGSAAGNLGGWYSQDENIHYVTFHFPFTDTYIDQNGREWPNSSSFQTLVLQFEKGAGPYAWYITNITEDYWTP